MIPHSIYIHIPFCRHRCGYCDFNTYSGIEAIIPDYIRAVCAEFENLAEKSPEKLPVQTIFFGGGTPSLLPIAGIDQLLDALHQNFHLQADVEITLEANPGTLSSEYLKIIRNLGINRLSLGMQSAHPDELRLLERQHDYTDVIRSVTWARNSGFENISLDLIFGLPEQKLDTWQQSLNLALGLHPEHFSLYSLTLEHGTPFGAWSSKGLLSLPDQDVSADMYEWASERLDLHGYVHYEISNWAKTMPEYDGELSGFLVCQHNLQYWRNLPYIGAGAGAHGFAAGIRTVNVLSPYAYIHRLLGTEADPMNETNQGSHPESHSGITGSSHKKQPGEFPVTAATISAQQITREIEMGETMIMGLRLVQEGVSNTQFEERFGLGLEEAFAHQIQRLLSIGLVEWTTLNHEALRLAKPGILLANQVFIEFV